MYLKLVRCKSADWTKCSRGQFQLRAVVNGMKCNDISGTISWRNGGFIYQLTGCSRLKNSLNFEFVTFIVHKSRVIYLVATASFRNSSVPHAACQSFNYTRYVGHIEHLWISALTQGERKQMWIILRYYVLMYMAGLI